MRNPETGTFSFLAISPDPQLMGVAVASGAPSVGQRVPHVQPGVGVIATQAYTRVTYGTNGIELLSQGLTPQQVLHRLRKEDPNRELRQVGIMDFKGRKATFTGSKTPQFHGEMVGKNYLAIGNMLTGPEVVASMAQNFESSKGVLSWRMGRALKAGKDSGGDRRGEKSAALTVVGKEKVKVKINVYLHDSPIEELRRHLE